MQIGMPIFGESKYIEYIPGNLPIIIVAPHGGYLNPKEFPNLPELHRNDNNSQEYARGLAKHLKTITGKQAHVVINHIRTEKFNPARKKEIATNGHTVLERVWEQFHEFIEEAKLAVLRDWGSGHYFECHVNAHREGWIEIGQGVSRERLNTLDSENADIESFIAKSCVRSLASKPHVDFVELIRGEYSLGGLLQRKGYKAIPSPKNQKPVDQRYFFAGWNLWKHGSRDGGSIDATHLETHFRYLRTPEELDQYCKDLSDVVTIWMEKHYLFDLRKEETSI